MDFLSIPLALATHHNTRYGRHTSFGIVYMQFDISSACNWGYVCIRPVQPKSHNTYKKNSSQMTFKSTLASEIYKIGKIN